MAKQFRQMDTHAAEPGTSANERVDVMFKLGSTCTAYIHSGLAQQQPHSAGRSSGGLGESMDMELCHVAGSMMSIQDTQAMSKHALLFSIQEEFGHRRDNHRDEQARRQEETPASAAESGQSHQFTTRLTISLGWIALRCPPRDT